MCENIVYFVSIIIGYDGIVFDCFFNNYNRVM